MPVYMHWVRCHHTAKFEISPILLALVWRRIAQVNDHKISGYIIWYTKYVHRLHVAITMVVNPNGQLRIKILVYRHA